MTTKREELEKALKADFHLLLVKEFTADWKVQRMVHDLELEVMEFEQLEALIQKKIYEEVEKQTPVKILGKSVDEIVVILNALEAERIADMTMTMRKLGDWMQLVQKDHHEAMQASLDQMFSKITERLNKGEK